MTAEIVNLRRARKQRARADRQATAEHNRVRFGRTKAERDAARSEQERLDRQLDQARLDHDD